MENDYSKLTIPEIIELIQKLLEELELRYMEIS